MNYWINIHWPPSRRDKPTPSSPDPRYHYNVYLPDGRDAAGEELKSDDLIFIYETKYGRPRKDETQYAPGREGIIALVRAKTRIEEKENEPFEEYTDGTRLCWKWQADTAIKKRGFCSRVDMCRALKYKPNWTLHGFGDLHSGLKKITEEQYSSILSKFR